MNAGGSRLAYQKPKRLVQREIDKFNELEILKRRANKIEHENQAVASYVTHLARQDAKHQLEKKQKKQAELKKKLKEQQKKKEKRKEEKKGVKGKKKKGKGKGKDKKKKESKKKDKKGDGQEQAYQITYLY